MPTRWQIVRNGDLAGVYESRNGRQFAPGDLVNLPPPFPAGTVWRVVAVQSVAEYDGRLIVEPARA